MQVYPLRRNRHHSYSSNRRSKSSHCRQLFYEALEDRKVLAAVVIDPGAFLGDYILGSGGTISGENTFELDPGTYQILLGNATGTSIPNAAASRFFFDVDASGNVTSQAPASAFGVGNTLTFHTVPITIDPGSFGGLHIVASVGDRIYYDSGPQTLDLVPGIQYPLALHAGDPLYWMAFDVSATGQVTTSNPDAVTAIGNTLLFNTVAVNVETSGFASIYQIGGINAHFSGSRSIDLVPGVPCYDFRIGSSNTPIIVGVDTSGTVTSGNPVAVSSSGNTLTFNTTQIHIDRNGFAGRVFLAHGLFDDLSPLVVKGLSNYMVAIAHGPIAFTFDVGFDGSVTSDNTAVATSSGDTLTLQTTGIRIDPDGFTGTYQIHDVATLQGTSNVVLVKGFNPYRIQRPGSQNHLFGLGSDGTPSPSVLPVTFDGIEYDFRLSQDSAPKADAGGPYIIDEGGDLQLDGSGSSDLEDGAALTYQWDLDYDGVSFDADATGVQPDVSFADSFSQRTIALRVTDSGNFSNIATSTLEVTNVAPAVGTITTSAGLLSVNSVINVSANFTDEGILDSHTAEWDWGDGSTSSGIVTESGGTGSVSNSHAYSSAGVYTVTLTVTDNDNDSGSSTFEYIVVYDPSAGFVTGGGWINSPAGALATAPELTGKANFGFVSRYQNGNGVPTGNTEFQFKVADFNFKSTSYEWLVVSGAKARFRGVGTVNGAGSYGFELTAWDGQVSGGGGVDKFRIKIWNQNQGNGVVYDNMLGANDGVDPTTTLGGGSIVIHKNNRGASASILAPLVTNPTPRVGDSLNQSIDHAMKDWPERIELESEKLPDESLHGITQVDWFSAFETESSRTTAKQLFTSMEERSISEDLLETIADARVGSLI